MITGCRCSLLNPNHTLALSSSCVIPVCFIRPSGSAQDGAHALTSPSLLGVCGQRCRVQLLQIGKAMWASDGPVQRPGLHTVGPAAAWRACSAGAVPDGTVSGGLLAGISAAGSAPSPINLALGYGVRETYHSKSVLLSCLGARHLFIPFSFIQSLE